MKKEQLFSLMPKMVIEDVEKSIQQQEELVKVGHKYVSQLSINRFVYKKLVDFTIDESLNLFSELAHQGFVIDQNLLFFDVDMESFTAILEEKFGLEDMYELDQYYTQLLLNGENILDTEVIFMDEKISFQDVLRRFVFWGGEMTIGDAPNLIMTLAAKNALLGIYLAKENIKKLSEGQKQIYNISVLL